ncbi:hypothetical protein ABW19_dt0209040 [Dactylella cylindrospora]|nr:hypothetical protein ABW19_dt0209040 [Dactylella cylindrospora]
MSHTAKRPRIHGPTNPALSLSSTSSLLETTRQATSSTPKLRNLQAEHENSLRKSALRLKSNWEDICRRYGRDFEGEGDEIDLETGEVVVDNGHLRGLSIAEDDTWAANAYDDDAASSSSSLDILGMRPTLGRDELRVPILRDDEAEEIDVDELEVDRDAIDDLFDELEELTMTTSTRAKLDEKKKREKQDNSHEADITQSSSQKETITLENMLSPASSEPAEPSPEELHLRSIIQAMEKDNVELPPVEELPSESHILKTFGVYGPLLLDLFHKVTGKAGTPEPQEPTFVAQLTPVSDCGVLLADKLVDEAEKQAAEQDLLVELPEPAIPLADSDEVGLEVDPEILSDLQVAATEELREALDDGILTSEVLEALQGPNEIESGNELGDRILAECQGSPEPLLGSLSRPVVMEDTPEPEDEAVPQPSEETVDHNNTNQNLVEEPQSELPLNQTIVSEVLAVENCKNEPVVEEDINDIDYLYGDIDDLTTILQPKSLVPVTPKNRPPKMKKSKSATAKKVNSTGKRGRPKRKLSDVETPEQAKPSSRKQKQPQTVPPKPKPPQFNSSPTKSHSKFTAPTSPRSFWSALPDDPFYDPLWQDFHPDGEPSHEEFERRRVILEEHAMQKREQEGVLDDDLMLVTPSISRVKKTPKSKLQATPKAKETKTPRSQKSAIKKEDSFEKKLHTPRSGKFLEYLQKKLLGEKVVKTELTDTETLEPLQTHGSDIQPEGEPATDIPDESAPKIKNEYGLSDDEDELSREVWFVKDKDVEIVGTRKQRRKRGRPPKDKTTKAAPVPVPLVVSDSTVPPSPPKPVPDDVKHEEEDFTHNPFATCGDPGYRCEKAICFSCIEDWGT